MRLFPLNCLPFLLLFCCQVFVSTAAAQARDPVIELFRLGQDDHLIIDRGGPVDGVGDVNGDGNDDVIVGSGIGSVRVVYGPTSGFNGTVNGQNLDGVSGFIIVHDQENLAVVANAGDINADGLNDILLGTSNGAQVIFGRRTGFNRIVDIADLNGRNGFRISSGVTDVSTAGDINADGIDDIIIGNANASANGLSGAGATHVIYGSRQPYPADFSLSLLNGTNGFSVLGTNSEDRSGRIVGAAGDFNNDGVEDFLIGAPNKTQNGKAEVGEAYLVYGQREPFPAAISLADIDGTNGLVFIGSDIQDSAGAAVAGIGDLNHDGYDDIAISAPGKGPFGSPSDYPGEVYVLFGNQFINQQRVSEADLDGTNGFVLRGIRGGVIPITQDETIWGDLAGTSLDGAGDINGDGIDDLLVGASHTVINPRRKGVGQTYFIYGSSSAFSARASLADLDGSNGFRINGIGTVDYFGVYARKAGDFDNDDIDDVIIGASGQGESYIIYGRKGNEEPVPDAPQREKSGAPSSGFLPIVMQRMPDAAPLRFNELADPTGPTPLPPGTLAELGNPLTPGDVRPNLLEPVAPLRFPVAAGGSFEVASGPSQLSGNEQVAAQNALQSDAQDGVQQGIQSGDLIDQNAQLDSQTLASPVSGTPFLPNNTASTDFGSAIEPIDSSSVINSPIGSETMDNSSNALTSLSPNAIGDTSNAVTVGTGSFGLSMLSILLLSSFRVRFKKA